MSLQAIGILYLEAIGTLGHGPRDLGTLSLQAIGTMGPWDLVPSGYWDQWDLVPWGYRDHGTLSLEAIGTWDHEILSLEAIGTMGSCPLRLSGPLEIHTEVMWGIVL